MAILPEKNWNGITAHHNAKGYIDDLCHCIDAAKHEVLFESYIFADDEVGNRVLQSLTNAASRGVTVRLLIDGVGSNDWIKDHLDELIQSPIHIRVFHPLPWPFSRFYLKILQRIDRFPAAFWRANRRNHRKMALVDGTDLFTGSINIFNAALSWRESGVHLVGGDLREIRGSFEEIWQKSETLRPPISQFAAVTGPVPDNPAIEINSNYLLRRKHNKKRVESIHQAKQRIWITNAYFVPPISMINALCSAAQRGVDVQLILPSITDIPLVRLASQYYYGRLLKAGVHIGEFQHQVLHSKVTIIDHLVSIGSSNFNHRSFFHDLELDILLDDEQTALSFTQAFENDLRQTSPVELSQLPHRSLWRRVLSMALLLFRHWM